MVMIPLPFVLAMVLGYCLLNELSQPRPRNRFVLAFLVVLIFQLVVVGIRFSYGIEALNRIFVLTGALVAPLAYLGFRNPRVHNSKDSWPLLIHMVPLLVACLLINFAVDFVDLAQGIFTLVYAGILLLLALRERDTLPWVDFNRRDYIRHALWFVVIILLVSGLTDIAIAIDAWQTRGENIPAIVRAATIFVAVLLVAYVAAKVLSTRQADKPAAIESAGDITEETTLLGRIDELMESTQLHLDPELNLNRIARKLGVPARQVSAAINRQRSVSVSQYINHLRIDEACRLLRETDLPITRVMLQSGFVTKSHFNREFSRRFDQSPSAWRARITAAT